MNNTFTFNRFALLFKKQFVENISTYLMSTAVLIGFLAVVLGFSAYVNDANLAEGTQFKIFIVLLMFSGVIFTSTIFTELGDKKKAIPMLTLPVSHLEKYLVGWIYSFLIFLLVFIACFYLVDSLTIYICNLNAVKTNEVLSLFDHELQPYKVISPYAILHALAFTGAIFFEKLHLIKTAFFTLIVVFSIFLLNQPIMRVIFQPEVRNAVPFDHVGVIDGKEVWWIQPTADSQYILSILVVLLILIFWASAYFKLKEKQV